MHCDKTNHAAVRCRVLFYGCCKTVFSSNLIALCASTLNQSCVHSWWAFCGDRSAPGNAGAGVNHVYTPQ